MLEHIIQNSEVYSYKKGYLYRAYEGSWFMGAGAYNDERMYKNSFFIILQNCKGVNSKWVKVLYKNKIGFVEKNNIYSELTND